MQPTKSPSYKPLILVASGVLAAIALTAFIVRPTAPEPIQLGQQAVESLNTRDAITTVSGTGERVVHVFMSADCVYCRKLEPELARLDNATVHRYFVPGRTPESRAQASAALCATDRGGAWKQIIAGVPFQSGACDDSALDRNLAAAKKLALVATPVVVTPQGKAIASYLPHAELEAFIK